MQRQQVTPICFPGGAAGEDVSTGEGGMGLNEQVPNLENPEDGEVPRLESLEDGDVPKSEILEDGDVEVGEP